MIYNNVFSVSFTCYLSYCATTVVRNSTCTAGTYSKSVTSPASLSRGCSRQPFARRLVVGRPKNFEKLLILSLGGQIVTVAILLRCTYLRAKYIILFYTRNMCATLLILSRDGKKNRKILATDGQKRFSRTALDRIAKKSLYSPGLRFYAEEFARFVRTSPRGK